LSFSDELISGNLTCFPLLLMTPNNVTYFTDDYEDADDVNFIETHR